VPANRTALPHRPAALLALAFCAALPLAACGSDDGGSAAVTPTPAVETPTPAPTPFPDPAEPTTTGGIDQMPGASTAPVSRAATNESTALMTAVRAARQEGYDRVVFEFRNAVPGYKVQYVDRPITADGSGEQVAVNGNAVAEIRMQNASGVDLSQASAPQTYTGPGRLTPPTSEIAEVARTGDFEGTLTWVVGVRDRVDFRVTTLTGPPRLVVDFRNH